MLSFISKVMLTFSALAPVAFIYAYVAWTQCQFVVAASAAIGGAMSVGLCLLVLNIAREKVTRSSFHAVEIEAADGENIGFLLLYLLPLFTDTISSLNWQLWLPTLALLGLLIGTGYAHHFNPLLGLFRWHFYKVKSKEGVVFILITKKRISDALKNLEVGELTDNILFDLGEKR